MTEASKVDQVEASNVIVVAASNIAEVEASRIDKIDSSNVDKVEPSNEDGMEAEVEANIDGVEAINEEEVVDGMVASIKDRVEASKKVKIDAFIEIGTVANNEASIRGVEVSNEDEMGAIDKNGVEASNIVEVEASNVDKVEASNVDKVEASNEDEMEASKMDDDEIIFLEEKNEIITSKSSPRKKTFKARSIISAPADPLVIVSGPESDFETGTVKIYVAVEKLVGGKGFDRITQIGAYNPGSQQSVHIPVQPNKEILEKSTLFHEKLHLRYLMGKTLVHNVRFIYLYYVFL